ncbi:MAG TPA: hypothetical protein VKH15_14475 [Candidatus Acidoferrum sp.]|nr:hypothetical protein [Candidatus Acidoferrum sp.]
MSAQIIPVFSAKGHPAGGHSPWWLTVCCCIYFAILCRSYFIFVPIFAELFKGLAVDLPFPTNLLMATYRWSLPLFYLFASGVAVIKQFVPMRGVRSWLANITLIFAGILMLPLVVLCMYLPLFVLTYKLSQMH